MFRTSSRAYPRNECFSLRADRELFLETSQWAQGVVCSERGKYMPPRCILPIKTAGAIERPFYENNDLSSTKIEMESYKLDLSDMESI